MKITINFTSKEHTSIKEATQEMTNAFAYCAETESRNVSGLLDCNIKCTSKNLSANWIKHEDETSCCEIDISDKITTLLIDLAKPLAKFTRKASDVLKKLFEKLLPLFEDDNAKITINDEDAKEFKKKFFNEDEDSHEE